MTAPEEGKSMTRLDAITSNSLGKLSLEEIHKSNSNFLTEIVCKQQTDTYLSAGRAGKEVRLDGYSYTELATRNAFGSRLPDAEETMTGPSEGYSMIFDSKRKFATVSDMKMA